MEGRYNMRSPAVKRLMKEAQELREPTEQYFAQPLDDNLFEWHFTIRGPSDSEFEGGIFHGRIILPPEYPMKPPSIMMLTNDHSVNVKRLVRERQYNQEPNGRFEILKKICLSISGHHPESWQPSWSIRTALLAIIGFMPTHGGGAIGSLDYSAEERKILSKKSQDFKCSICGTVNNTLKPVTEASEKTKQEAKELASQINFQGEKEKKEQSSSPTNESGASSGPTSESTASPDGASATSPSPPSPPNFPWPMPPGMAPFHGSPGNQQFPFPPPPFMVPPAWQNHTSSAASQIPRFPPYFMHPSFFHPPSPMTSNSQMPHMAHLPAWFPRPPMGQTSTTDSSSRPVMSEKQRPSESSSDSTKTTVVQSVAPTTSLSAPTQSPSTTATSSQSSPSPVSSSQLTAAGAVQTSTQSAPTVSSTEGLRQRQAARPQTSVPQTAVPRPAPVVSEGQGQPHAGGIMSAALILVVGLTILLLLIRRLYIMNVLM